MGVVAHGGRSRAARLVVVALTALAPAVLGQAEQAAAHHTGSASGFTAADSESDGPASAAAIAECTGTTPNQGSIPITEDIAVSGEFGKEVEGSYVMVPFQVPAGTDAIRVKYCHDQPAFTNDQNKHTIDMGLYQSRSAPGGLWADDEFRGWGGSSRKDVTVSPEGTFDPPNPVATQKTTVGYLPGPIPSGEWAAELGVAAIGTEGPTEDGKVSWRVEIELIDDPDFADQPYAPVPYDGAAADPDPGWYAGDVHVHARHSNPGDATMRETFSYAFCPDAPAPLCDPAAAKPGAGLDFITLSDYVTTRHWGEIGAFQDDYPGKLIVRSAEVITYRGHVNNHASYEFADYRTGAIYERTPDGTLSLLRAARPASAIFDEIRAAGGFTQINHPETFPSEVPTFGNLCRGCSWEYSDADTDYSKVDAIEVATGPAGLQQPPFPGPNPFTPLAIQFYEHGLDTGAKIAAVGSSDSHNAGSPDDPVTQSPIGQATTVVRAPSLSEKGIQAGVEAGHTFAKIWAENGPDLRFCAGDLGPDGVCSEDFDAAETIMGDTVVASSTEFTARVLSAEAMAARPGAYTLIVFKDGEPVLEVPLADDDFSFQFPSFGPLGTGRYRLQVMRLASGVASIENVSSPIYLEPPPPDGDGDGVPDEEDNCPGAANAGQEDLDGDGVGDACDSDRDGDGVPNGDDACADEPGPPSNDGCPVVGDDDNDDDGILNDDDNCENTPNADQADLDMDGVGDVCDGDRDGDGTANEADECPDEAGPVANRGCPPDLDQDGDGVENDADNCPVNANPDQADTDGDGLGDVCDADDDGDGIADGQDGCPRQPGPGSNLGCPEGRAVAADCANVRTGTPGRDRLEGGADGDRLVGLRGRDVLLGREGDDCLEGRGGGDRLRGGPGSDLLIGGRGPDLINALDGEADVVSCGRGRDLARIDAVDRVLGGCERVRRP